MPYLFYYLAIMFTATSPTWSWSIVLKYGSHKYEGYLYAILNDKAYSIYEASIDTLKLCCHSNGYQYASFHYDHYDDEKVRYPLECGNTYSKSCLGSASYSDQKIWLQCLPTCDEGRYLNRDIPQCLVCPQGSTSQKNSEMCNCLAGSYWSYGQCKECPKNTYSLFSATECMECQEDSSSVPGSSHCNCTAGYYLSTPEQCSQCQVGYFSYEGSTKCTKCPNGSLPLFHKAYCGCPNGKFWNTSKSDCDLCPESESKTECVDCQKSFPSSDVSRCIASESDQNSETTKELISLASMKIVLITTSILILMIIIIGVYASRSKIAKLPGLLRILRNKLKVEEVEIA